MSATFMPQWLKTVDFDPSQSSASVRLEDDDLAAPELKRRVNAHKTLRRAYSTLEQSAEIALGVLDAHRPKSRTLVVVNTVARALNIYERMQKLVRERALSIPVVLVHSRFRPNDRRLAVDRLLAEPTPEGTVVVSTQVVEAGVDVSAATLFTELAPWPSLVQRFGRCNRAGEDQGAIVYWLNVPSKGNPDRYAAPGAKGDETGRVRLTIRPIEAGGRFGAVSAIREVPQGPLPASIHALRRRRLDRALSG